MGESISVGFDLDPDRRGEILTRLRRAHGQIAGVIGMVESGRDCGEVVTQLAAARKAIDRAGFLVVNDGLRQCLSGSGPVDNERLAALERLFLALS